MLENLQNINFIDCHSHPHDSRYKKENINIDKALEELRAVGGATIAIGTDYTTSGEAIDLSERHTNVWASIGIHPVDKHDEIFDTDIFDSFLKSKKVVAIGECGLDYYYFEKILLENKDFDIAAEKSRQRNIFIKQIEYALENNLPLILHGRPSKNSMDAYRDILDILESYKNTRGHAHFFVGNIEIAKRFLDLGFLLSFDGPITFTSEYDEVIKYIPIEMLMIETDSPYAAPLRYRGQINYPIYVLEVAKKIAYLKNLSVEEVLEITKNNAIKLFTLK